MNIEEFIKTAKEVARKDLLNFYFPEDRDKIMMTIKVIWFCSVGDTHRVFLKIHSAIDAFYEITYNTDGCERIGIESYCLNEKKYIVGK